MNGLRLRRLCLLAAVFACGPLFAETQTVDGVRYECTDGLCRMIGPEENAPAPVSAADCARLPRLVQGYQSADEFLAFLSGKGSPSAPAEHVTLLTVILILLGGLALNLTPCVLPMIPVNLIVIGGSFRRALAYAAGIALSYGALGVLASLGFLAFGTIQSNPVFNACVALVFAALSLSLFGVFNLDFARFRGGWIRRLGPFAMGALTSVLAGACVAPVLISVLILTADLSAKGEPAAFALPFVLGLGLALPWPFLGAGLSVLPRPGVWMKWVNRLFAVILLALAVWYGALAWPTDDSSSADSVTPSTFAARFETAKKTGRPVLVDCWASWCKNCTALERGTLQDSEVRAALEKYSVIRLQAEDLGELRRLPGFEAVKGLPAFIIFE